MGRGRAAPVITVLVPPGSLLPGATVELDQAEAHHLKVRRADDVEPVRLVDGGGTVAQGRLRLSRTGAEALIDAVSRVEPPVAVTLALGAGARERFALVVEKAAELGATDVVPLETERSRNVGSRVRPAQLEGMRRRAREAMKQCGSAWATRIHEPRRLEDFLVGPGVGALWLADHQGDSEPRLGPTEPVTVAVGPEGGFTDPEIQAMLAAGFARVKLGPHVLRFETAALAALAVIWQVRSRGAHG